MSFLRPCVFACAVVTQLAVSQTIADPASAAKQECGLNPNVTIDSASQADARYACLGANDAVRFLSSQGFAVPAVSIRIVDAMPQNIPESALGAFSRSRNEIFILSLPVFLDHSQKYGIFNIPVDDSVYRAVIAHEVAHAIAFHNFRATPTLLAQEYIGFVTFFTALERNRRDNILRRYQYDEEWLGYPAILYLTDQVEFGAHAYWHFHRPDRGRHFFQQILDGKALGTDE